MAADRYELTAVDIMDLRLWRARSGSSLDGGPSRDVPFIVIAPSDGSLYLHSQGRTVAGTLSPQVMCALLHNERLEPGFCDRVARADVTIEQALWTPERRAASIQRRAVLDAQDRQARADQEHARTRRLSQLVPKPSSTLELDDLLG